MGASAAYQRLVTIDPEGQARWTGRVELDQTVLGKPLHWQAPRHIVVNEMSDLFHTALTNEQIAAVFGVMAACKQHTFQVSTKHAQRMRAWFEWIAVQPTYLGTIKTSPRLVCRLQADKILNPKMEGRPLGTEAQPRQWPLPNVWIGVSVENQAAADERIPDLLATPAAVRFISAEPLLGEVNIRSFLSQGGDVWPSHLDWIIAGCESGPDARVCNVEWLRQIRDQCKKTNVPFFLKQARMEKATPDDPETSEGFTYSRVWQGLNSRPNTRRKPGTIIELPYLDGVQHTAMPGDCA